MEAIATIAKWISLGALILVASFAVGGLYQGVAVSNGNSAGDICLSNRFTGAFYVCRNRTCQPGKFSNRRRERQHGQTRSSSRFVMAGQQPVEDGRERPYVPAIPI